MAKSIMIIGKLYFITIIINVMLVIIINNNNYTYNSIFIVLYIKKNTYVFKNDYKIISSFSEKIIIFFLVYIEL